MKNKKYQLIINKDYTSAHIYSDQTYPVKVQWNAGREMQLRRLIESWFATDTTFTPTPDIEVTLEQ